MLKQAYEEGIKLALNEVGLTPEQMAAAQRITGVGGGVLGATGGGLLGKYLGGQVAEALREPGLFSDTYPISPETAKLIGGGLGTLAGGALGGYVGSQIPRWRSRVEEPETEESALGVLPVAYQEAYYPETDYGYYGY